MKWILILIAVFVMSLVSAADFTPQGDINLRDTYNIENMLGIDGVNATFDNNVTADIFVGDGSFLTGVASNSSDYWDSMDSINTTQMENSGGILNILPSWLKSLFYTKAEVTTNISSANTTAINWVDALFPKISELVGLLGNWSADQTNYYNKTEVTANITSANSSMGAYVNSQDTSFNNTMKNYADGTFITQANEGNLNVNQSDWWITYNSASDLNNLITINALNISIGTIAWARMPTIYEANISDLQDYILWSNAVNGTLYLSSNPSGYIGWSNAVNGTLYLASNPSNYIGWSNAVNGTLFTQVEFNTNYTANDAAWRSITNSSYYLATNPLGFYNSTNPGVETLWNANYSVYLTKPIWSVVMNGTVVADWNNNYSTFLTHLTWVNAVNGTLFTQDLWNTNYTTNNDLWLADTFVNADCATGQFVQNITGGDTLECAAPAGGGDITGVYGDDVYIYNGSASGEVTLALNETKLNDTIGIYNDSMKDYVDAVGDTDTWADNFTFYYNKTDVTTNITNANSSMKVYCDAVDTATNTTATNWVDALFVKFSELVAQVGNWSADITNYYTKTEVTANITAANSSMKNYCDANFRGISNFTFEGNVDLNDNDLIDVDDIGSTTDEIDDIYIGTNQKIYFGDGQEFSQYYNGTYLITG